MFFLESLSLIHVEIDYRLSFQAGQTIKHGWGSEEQHGLFRLLGVVNCFSFSEVQSYDRKMVQDYCVNDLNI